MRPGLGQHTQLKQELKINPRLYQAMDLLYMPLLDLQNHLKQELLNNPFLDMVEPEDEDDENEEGEIQEEPNPETEAEKEEKGEIDWEEILLDGFDAGGRREEHEEREYYEPVTVATRDLADHLRDQVTLLDLSGRQMYLAEEFIGNVNEDGYLACGLEKIVEGVNESVAKVIEEADREVSDLPLYTPAEAEEMLGVIQSLDPPGVGARDLRECLMLQLREASLEHSVPFRLVRDCFDELIAHRWSEISKRFGISPVDVQKAADEIAKLDPKPGLVYSDASDNYIIPDLISGQFHRYRSNRHVERFQPRQRCAVRKLRRQSTGRLQRWRWQPHLRECQGRRADCRHHGDQQSDSRQHHRQRCQRHDQLWELHPRHQHHQRGRSRHRVARPEYRGWFGRGRR